MFGFGAFSTQPFCSIDYTSIQPTVDTHDGGFKRKTNEKKLAEARLKLIEAKKEQRLARKQAISDLVDPKEYASKNKKILSKIIVATKEIKEIEQEQHEYVNTFYIEQELARIQAHYEIMRIMQIQAQDEEDAIIALLLGD
jgi:hypothetical protein